MRICTRFYLLVCASFFVLVCSCATGSKTVKKRAAYDLDCPKDQIVVEHIGGTSYGAKGCDKQATYTCDAMTKLFGVKCIKDSQGEE